MHVQWHIVTFLLGTQLAGANMLRPAAAVALANLEARDAQCPEATQTLCSDGTGCCPSGVACIYQTGIPKCDSPCNGGPTCKNGNCCEIGYICDSTGILCVLDTAKLTGIPIPTFTSMNPGGPIETTDVSSTMPEPATSSGAGGSSSTNQGGGSSNNASGSSASTPSITSSSGSMPSSTAGSSSSSAGAASSTTSPGIATSLGSDSWTTWLFAWVIGLPLIA
ncbi:hypothetical protein N7462_000789 [Penicillium macrosclerotiorum]|uniref:uncharacterized protein n=1 Tax=Penicillium macrosclerotiorum TaxID=303699 RepID=UPI0025472A89|nr:uncharacterized protein N7462_000789 [Penicillium macrosclerotiorum]KAJ5698784.1 hypothetical protein N7462_000789 [Penicillium macrosclerotiorum]